MQKFTLLSRDIFDGSHSFYHVEGVDLGAAQDAWDAAHECEDLIGAFPGHVEPIWWEVQG